MFIKFVSLLLMNLYEYIGNGKDFKEVFDYVMRDVKDVVFSCGRVVFFKDIVLNSLNEII